MKQNTRRTKIRSEHFAYISNENDQLKKMANKLDER